VLTFTSQESPDSGTTLVPALEADALKIIGADWTVPLTADLLAGELSLVFAYGDEWV
jgi:hypothetical protein